MKKLLFLLVLLAPIGAHSHEVRIGLLVHDVAPLFGANKVEGGFSLNEEFIFGDGVVRPNVGLSLSTLGYTSCVYGGIVLGTDVGHWSVFCALGGAAQVNSIRNMGSTLQFRLTLEIGYKDFSILLCHLSNGAGFFWWDTPNAGLDKLGIRYRIRF